MLRSLVGSEMCIRDSTNTTTNTVTNTSTNTNTNTNTITVTQTRGTDSNNDGILQDNEIPLDGSGGNELLWTDPAGSYASYEVTINQDITQDIVLGDSDLAYVDGDGNVTYGNGQNLTLENFNMDTN